MRVRTIAALALVVGSATAAWAQPQLSIKADAGIIIDAATGIVLWEKNPDAKMFPASTTKIMTGLLLLENTSPTDQVIAPRDVTSVGESSMNLRPREKLTASDLLTAIMLRSANDAAYTAAIHIAGSKEKFAAMMNERAAELGCSSTHFMNPHGLHNESHYTSARDLAIMARAAMHNEEFRAVVRQPASTISRGDLREEEVSNRNRWLSLDSSADGIKTGYTKKAGRCFVGSATRNDWQVITVQLHSPNWMADQPRMVDWAFTSFAHAPTELDAALGLELAAH
ncbi:MAG: D-alanyl-D-alanine carboxypeptidase [Chthonomonas sp.]|nr:D-alanyl-D-alanine carboxypeptidase [Chthonomonas sp.]